MAKRRRKGGRRTRRKGKKRKGGTKSGTKSLILLGAAALDGYKVLTAPVYGGSLGGRLMAAPFNSAERAAITGAIKDGSMKAILVGNTKELQLVAGAKVLEAVPVIKEPIKIAGRGLNRAGRAVGIKGKYKVW